MADLFGRTELAGKQASASRLGRRWGAPPFSALDARAGWWVKRKRQWKALGVDGGKGRGVDDVGKFMAWDMMRQGAYSKKWQREGGKREYDADGQATSIFDPVLAELMYRWFCPVGGHVLDPFAGECTKGIVAATLGFHYTGIELRQEQVDINRQLAKESGLKLDLLPVWICGDTTRIHKVLPSDYRADMVFTSPPYYDLEVYSDGSADGSAKQTYEEFLVWYARIFKRTLQYLKPNRFLVVKVGEIRDKTTGAYRNFVGDTIRVLRDLGLVYYNELILVTSVGSLRLRITKQFSHGCKIGKMHQNILCFWKGDPKNVKKVFRERPER